MAKKINNWYNTGDLENNILKFWKEKNIFEKLKEKNKNGTQWSFLDGPITANNPMGIHHAWGRALKDLFQRYWAMNGRKQRYQNGYDCQGLWVEVEVEKELGFKTKKDIEAYGIDKFVEKCKARVNKYADKITQQSILLGYWMNWNNSYFTMSDENNYTIWAFLKKCHERGLIYKGHDVMPWCPRCGTGISQHEMQEGYKEVSHLSIIAKFKIKTRTNEYFLVWTTTPWTLSSNVAIAVHPDLEYVKIEQEESFYYIQKDLAELVMKKNKKTYTIIKTFTGQEIIDMDLYYEGPFDDLPAQQDAIKAHKVISWKEISNTEGTGIVHIAPGCGAEDFQLGKEYDLPAICPINDAGIFIEDFGSLTGKNEMDVADDVVRKLEKEEKLFSSDNFIHSYPHCWRCSTPLLFRLVNEWFIEMDSWRNDIKEVAKQIQWIPSYGLDLELDWLTNMRDWMISKNRYWGLALPFWECEKCGRIEVIGSYEELKIKATEGWDKFEGKTPHKPWIDAVKIKCEKCGAIVSRIKAVGNPWLDAGIIPYSTVKYNSDKSYWQEWIPADLVLECFPGQFRNWFYSLLAMSTMMENIPPFKTLVGHALVRDENGEEMHKSKGNAIWFDDAVKKIGADIIRWTFFLHDIQKNINFGYIIAKQLRGKFFNTLWNCHAFFTNYANLIEYQAPVESEPHLKDNIFDRWIISKTNILIQTCRKSVEDYNIRTACTAINDYIDDLSNWYIRHNRRRFWKTKDDKDTINAFNTLYECMYTLICILAPFVPFITEEIYQSFIKNFKKDARESVHLCDFPSFREELIDKDLIKEMDTIKNITKAALFARQSANIKIRHPLQELSISIEEQNQYIITKFEKLLKDDLNIKEIRILKTDEEAPFEYNVKPDIPTIKDQYPKNVGEYIKAINAHKDMIAKRLKNKEKDIVIDSLPITEELLILEKISPENLSYAPFTNGWVSLNVALTPEFILEGQMRDLIRKAQVLRKELDFEAEDRIEIKYHTTSKILSNVIDVHKEYICNELLCLHLIKKENLEGNKLKINNEEIILNIKVI